MNTPIYLDYHATTPVDPRVLEIMLPYFTQRYGNAASRSHSFGWQADEAVQIARQQIADLLQTDPAGIFFTSGATEGINMLLKGLTPSNQRNHIITFTTEHRAVLDTIDVLEKNGFEVTRLPVSASGEINVDEFSNAIRKNTCCAVIMWANNETGVIHDMSSLGAICKKAGIVLMSDATQAVGKIQVHPLACDVDMLALSAHKMYGPKGVGAVYINPDAKIKLSPLIHGGGHEKGLRSGTLNVPGIAGLGAAAKMAKENMEKDQHSIRAHRDHFENRILAELEYVTVNGSPINRLHTVSNLQLAWTDSQAIMSAFRTKLAISAGSACSAADPSPSHVLLAMGLTAVQAKASVRISFGRPTTLSETDEALTLLIEGVNSYRSTSPAWNMYRQGLITDQAG